MSTVFSSVPFSLQTRSRTHHAITILLPQDPFEYYFLTEFLFLSSRPILNSAMHGTRSSFLTSVISSALNAL